MQVNLTFTSDLSDCVLDAITLYEAAALAQRYLNQAELVAGVQLLGDGRIRVQLDPMALVTPIQDAVATAVYHRRSAVYNVDVQLPPALELALGPAEVPLPFQQMVGA